MTLYGRTTSKLNIFRHRFQPVVATVVVACALTYPVDAAAESVLEYAVFNPEAGTLEMVFDGQPVYGNLMLRPDGAYSFSAYVVDVERPNVLHLDTEALKQFHNMDCPTLHVDAGSFLDANGSPNDHYTAPLWVVPHDGWEPPRPGVDVSCTLTYGIVESPLTPSGDLLNAVHDGLAAWSKVNPGMELRHVEDGTPNISIEFGTNGALGQACTDCLYTFTTVDVFQECYDRYGPPNHGGMIMLNADILNYDTMRDAAAHEFGHTLGLCHNDSTDHLMYSGEGMFQTPYDNLGYDIPDMLGIWPTEPLPFGVPLATWGIFLVGLAIVIMALVIIALIVHVRRKRRRAVTNQ